MTETMVEGLSPRMRGNLLSRACDRRDGCHGSIPAHAGEPNTGSAGAIQAEGLSPRMRGNPQRAACFDTREDGSIPAHAGEPPGRVAIVGSGIGSIPAHAGEPSALASWGVALGVYPRACGGTRSAEAPLRTVVCGSIPAHAGEPRGSRPVLLPAWGLSPRMRGNLDPDVRDCFMASSRVYPRACGGTRGQRDAHVAGLGSIPAHAGEPQGKARVGRGLKAVLGLSPRMRGNPRASWGLGGAAWVYPRACGGNRDGPPAPRYRRMSGLSPRMRGNLLTRPYLVRWVVTLGSIPAHAGEPVRLGFLQLSDLP